MTKISQVFCGALLLVFFAQSNAEAGCVDGRLVRMDCRPAKKIMTHYGCEDEFFVQCLPLAEIPLLEGVTSGGFRRQPQIEMTSILRDGKAIQTVKSMDIATGTWTTKSEEALVLGSKILKAIADNSAVLQAGAPFEKPTEPPCMDAPTTLWTAYIADATQASATEIPFYKIEACNELLIRSNGVYDLRTIAKSTDQLSNYVR